jgi:hypothetical protein
MISFVFPSWIMNEFHEYISEYNLYKSLWKMYLYIELTTRNVFFQELYWVNY